MTEIPGRYKFPIISATLAFVVCIFQQLLDKEGMLRELVSKRVYILARAVNLCLFVPIQVTVRVHC